MRAEPEAQGTGTRGYPVLVLLPLLAFLGLAGVFLIELASGRDPATVPSALIGAPAPKTVLPALAGSDRPGLDLTLPPDKPTLVNVFASWCGPCREEHPILTELGKDKRFRLVAINHKDKPDAALAFLQNLGNPYSAIGADEAGRATIDWGVYGVPESFLVGTDGRILWKQIGPFTEQAVRTGLYPALEKALGGKPSSQP